MSSRALVIFVSELTAASTSFGSLRGIESNAASIFSDNEASAEASAFEMGERSGGAGGSA